MSFAESRRKSIVAAPSMRINWVAFIAANFLAEKFDTAYSTIESFRDTWKADTSSDPYEESEMVFFYALLLQSDELTAVYFISTASLSQHACQWQSACE